MQKTYETYKDSGIEWIGNVPSHWASLPIKHYIGLEKGTKPADLTDENTGFPYLTMDYLRCRDGKITMYPTTTDGLNLIEENEILVLWDGANAGEFLLSKKGYIGSTMARISVDESKYDKKYFYLLLKAIEKASKDYSNGTTIPHFDSKVLSDYYYPCPSLSEQQAIAEYLDKNCSKIDALIAELEQQVTDLGTMKKAEISRVVTKGLNPDAPLKESEIEWIGKVPSHWEISKIKFEAQTSSGSTPRTIAGKEKGSIIWVRTTDLNDNIVINSSEYLSEDEYKSASCPWLSKNTLLISMYGGAGSIGKCGLLGIEATINQALCAITFKSTHIPKYYFYLGIAIRPYWMKFAASTRKDPNISQEIIRNTFIPVPSQLDQLQIVEYLDTYSEKVDATVKELQDQIADLKLYKQSIISEAVTGKIKVID